MIPKKKLEVYGVNPEILISIRAKNGKKGDRDFDKNHSFLLQLHTNSQEILRTHTTNTDILANEWYYFHFYNNGNSNTLKVYLNSTGQDHLTVAISKGIQSRPPYTNKAISEANGIGHVTLSLNNKDVNNTIATQKNNIRGNFVVAVRSKTNTQISIFWNNKEDLNYIELTNNQHTRMNLEKKKHFYFSFFVRDSDSQKKADRGKIMIYLKTSVQSTVYVLRTLTNDMDAPSESNYSWKTSTGRMGGLTAIEINPNDSEYCVECTYIGYIEAKEEGKVDLIPEIEHIDEPINLKVNVPFPCFLAPLESKMYKIHNSDSDIIDVTLDLFQGYVDVYIHDN